MLTMPWEVANVFLRLTATGAAAQTGVYQG
jgi:hypothetical protein